jgi:hypothetical protein
MLRRDRQMSELSDNSKCRAANTYKRNDVKSTHTLEPPTRAGGSRFWIVGVCCLLVVRVGVCVAMSLSPCFISVLSPFPFLQFYLSVVGSVYVAVLVVVVVITEELAAASVAVIVVVSVVIGIHACTRACAHGWHTSSSCTALSLVFRSSPL